MRFKIHQSMLVRNSGVRKIWVLILGLLLARWNHLGKQLHLTTLKF